MRVNGWQLLFYGPYKLRDNLSQSFAWLGGYIPRRRLYFQYSRELAVKGASAPPFYGGLPLTDGPGCAISRWRGGGISSRAAPFPVIGKGRGDWVERLPLRWRNKMNFTNSPYEKMMKEMPKGRKSFPMPEAPSGTHCKGCPYWRGISCVFCYREHLKKQD